MGFEFNSRPERLGSLESREAFDMTCDNWVTFWNHIKYCEECKKKFEEVMLHSYGSVAS